MKSKLTGPKTSIILNGLKEGKTEAQIARDVGVHQSSVSRFLARIKPYFQDLEEVTANRGNIFNYLHSRSLKIQNEVLDELERLIQENSKKDPSQRMKLGSVLYALRGLGMNATALYDNLRLEGGQSTSNIGIAGLITHAHRNGVFDEKTGEFRQSLVGRKPTSSVGKSNALNPDTRNELETHESPMPIDDGEKTSDKGNSVN